MRSCIGSARIAGPRKCTAWVRPPSMPSWPQRNSITSLATTQGPNLPLQSISIVSGTLSQISPVASTPGHFGCTDAEHVGAEGAAGRRMAVAADHEHAGLEMPALRQHDVADALAVVEAGELVLGRELARDLADAARLVVARRNVVIADQHDLARVPQSDAEALEDRRHAPRPAGVVDHRKIDGARDDLAGHDALASGRARDDLFGQRHRHGGCLFATCAAARLRVVLQS